MKLHFSISYRTQWGEHVCIEIIFRNARGRESSAILSMETHDGENWTIETIPQQRDIRSFTYRYAIYRGEECIRREWGIVPRTFMADDSRTFTFPDAWQDAPRMAYRFSTAFTRCIQPQEPHEAQTPYFSQTLLFRVMAPQLADGQALALVGSQPPLGDWKPERALRMERAGIHEWRLSLSAAALQIPFEYKYVVINEQSGELLMWEEGANRLGRRPQNTVEFSKQQSECLVLSDGTAHLPENKWKAAGVVIPVFSLRSEGSQGVGDFGDLKKMVQWAVRTGMKVVQVLPIYDTTITHTWHDCYPYNAVSIYALHPQYVDIRQLPALKDKELQTEMSDEWQRLNQLPQIDYEATNRTKRRYLRALYEQEGEKTRQSTAFQQFFDANAEWLKPYAVFSYLRDEFGTSNFRSWPRLSTYKAEEMEAVLASAPEATGYYVYVQYLLHLQLSTTATYARKHGVILKGDIPIGISSDSVEAWVEPYYFNMNGSAGAPPDAFSVDGQNWGFPTYDWDRMAQDGYRWWRRRFEKMGEYFDAYRIDHVLGFFRIWEIPTHSVHGLLGQFQPAMPMSIDDIEEMGLPWRGSLYTRPYITDQVLADIFGDQATRVRETYLINRYDGRYELRKEVATQRLVQALDIDDTLRQGLYHLISNVLFLEDHKQKNLYHPRIGAMDDEVRLCLKPADLEAFKRIHHHFYYERHNEFWYAEAMRKLPALIEATPMLVCAEDLGMVPQCVPWVMNDLRILSLEIQSMPKALVRFGNLAENPYLSVATIFTHDMPTLRQWWAEDAERRQAYYSEVLQKDGEAPAEMPGWLAEEVVSRHLFSPSMLCLISWQDWMATNERLRLEDASSERINIPANPHHYWRYRMHINIDRLLRQEEFNNHLRELIQRSGR